MPDRSRLLDVGNCTPDHTMIRAMLEANFNVDIDRVMFVPDALNKMRKNKYDLVIINRLIFDDNSEGLELVRQAKADATVQPAPMMLISNLPQWQATSVEAGGVPGFGKAKVTAPETVQLIGKYLTAK